MSIPESGLGREYVDITDPGCDSIVPKRYDDYRPPPRHSSSFHWHRPADTVDKDPLEVDSPGSPRYTPTDETVYTLVGCTAGSGTDQFNTCRRSTLDLQQVNHLPKEVYSWLNHRANTPWTSRVLLLSVV